MKKKSIFIALTIFSCCSQKHADNNPINKNIFGSIEIPIKENFNPDLSRIQHYISDSGEHLVIQNKTSFELGVFSLDSKDLKITIPLQKEGPDGVGLINGFQLVSKDTILIAAIPPRIHFVNIAGEKFSTITIEDPEKKANYLSSNNETPFIYSKGIIYGIQPYFGDLYSVKPEEVKKSHPIFKVSSTFNDKSKLEWLSILRPEDEWINGKKSLDVTWTENGDSILISPQLDHKLWIISKEKEKIVGYKEIKSNKINGFRIIEDLPVGDSEIIKDLENGRYELLLFDHFRKVYYRFFYPSIDWESYNLSPREMMQNHPKLGVLILDQNLNIIGEHIFEKNYAQAWNYFVGIKGLYVSTNNPNRDDFDENVLRYDIIRFEGLNYED